MDKPHGLQTLYYKQNRLKQLRALCHAARTGSISAAAESLFLNSRSNSVTPNSLQIQALEREFGVTLFERRGPQIKLTPEGELLYQLARPLVEGVDKLHEVFAARYGKLESGELNVAAGESTILYILPEPLREFADSYPGIQLKLHNVTGRDGLAMLRADTADFAVGSMLDVPEDIVYHPVVSYDPMLIAPIGHPLAKKKRLQLTDISPYGLILPPRHLSTWAMVDTVFRQHNVPYHVALEAGGWEVIKKYVELGLGVSIVSGVCLTGHERVARKFLSPQAKRFIEMMEAWSGQAGNKPDAASARSSRLAQDRSGDGESGLSTRGPAWRTRLI